MKIRLYTHTDLDGSGCVIACQEAFGRENVDWSAHDYTNIDDTLMKEIVNDPTIFNRYDLIFIADISGDQPTAWQLDNISDSGKLWQFDHHKTRSWQTRFSWVVYDEARCGAHLIFDWLRQEGYLDVGESTSNGLSEFIKAVMAYDIWLLTDPHRAMGEDLNRVHGTLGQSVFLSLDRPEIMALEVKMHDALVKKEKDVIESGAKKAIRLVDENGIPFVATIATIQSPKVARRMLDDHPQARYAAVFNPIFGVASLYSRNGHDFDVSAIAKERHPKGGGHAAASGYELRHGFMKDLILTMMGSVGGNEVAPQ